MWAEYERIRVDEKPVTWLEKLVRRSNKRVERERVCVWKRRVGECVKGYCVCREEG